MCNIINYEFISLPRVFLFFSIVIIIDCNTLFLLRSTVLCYNHNDYLTVFNFLNIDFFFFFFVNNEKLL